MSNYPPVSTRPLADIARDHAASRTLDTATRSVFERLAMGEHTEIAETNDALFAAALSCATRQGRSMARRAMTADLMRLRDSLVDHGDAYSLPRPTSYTTGAPVSVTLNDDGTVSVVVYLGEVAQDDDADITDDERAAVAAAVERGGAALRFSYSPGA